MSKKQFSAEDLEDVRALERTRVAMVANRQRRVDIRNAYLGNKSLEDNARLSAWAKVGRVQGTIDNPVCPPGWPAPYRDYEHWLSINLEGWSHFMDDDGPIPATSAEDKHIAAFRKALEGK
ncbi:MAG: hypothetical protein CTY20_07840 [Hyphomicrobium sp.]|nr:MAG: hypothetical protein CTY20_07840 [Hyphomicrobium sp.]